MNTYDNDMINRYIDGELTEEERKAFEEQVLQDETLKKELELYREVNGVLKRKSLLLSNVSLAPV